jgi:hypothetical protein
VLALSGGTLDAGQHRRRVPERIGVRLNREHVHVVGVAQATCRLDQGPPRVGTGICPPGTRGDQPEQSEVELAIAGLPGVLGSADQRRGPCRARCSKRRRGPSPRALLPLRSDGAA